MNSFDLGEPPVRSTLAWLARVAQCGRGPTSYGCAGTADGFEVRTSLSAGGDRVALCPAYLVQLRQVPNGYRIHLVTESKGMAARVWI